MENLNNPSNLDQILDEYVVENDSLSKEMLQEWIRRYPQYERELMDLTVALIQLQSAVPAEISEDEEEILVQRGISVVRRLLQDDQNGTADGTGLSKPIQGLVKEAGYHDLSLDQLAEQVCLTPSLLAKIDRHSVEYDSLPPHLFELFAETLHQNVFIVAGYCQLAPAIPQDSRFKSKTAPSVTKQVNFFDEIRKDPEFSDELRKYWLKFESQNK